MSDQNRQMQRSECHKRYQVFVSSTFIDLIEERRAVSNVLAKAGYLVAGMELFPATDQQQFDYIKTVIDRSDYYVVIVGARYGSVTDGGLSFTEMEFEYARSKNIPVLAFLHDKPGSIAADRTDQNTRKAAALVSFRQKLSTGRIVEHWSDVGSLCTHVVIAVGNEITLRPGVGWVRGDNAVDLKILQETERLRMENAGLRERLAEISGSEITFDPELVGPLEDFEFEVSQSEESGEHVREFKSKLQIRVMFVNLYDWLLESPLEVRMAYLIGDTAARLTNNVADSSQATDRCVVSFRDQLEALGLIRPEMRLMGGHSATQIAWALSDKGRRYANMQRAMRRPKVDLIASPET
ncbi:DUF4062 domain-containing protein [Tardiphaga sp. 71_E8_N1_1]|uniref:DUF4062 domain-containing protein n=1 Tax=Tardiphaga sp. 71_E8_N1_1 TaxID=3240784 RepID=UPI003F88B255